MCTYNLTFNDKLLERAKGSFPNQSAITTWMEQQIERMLKQIAIEDSKPEKPLRKINVSDRIKALSNVPVSSSQADYKDEITNILSDKY